MSPISRCHIAKRRWVPEKDSPIEVAKQLVAKYHCRGASCEFLLSGHTRVAKDRRLPLALFMALQPQHRCQRCWLHVGTNLTE